MYAAGGGVQGLLAKPNLSWKPIKKWPTVYDSYRFPQGITTGTIRLVPTCLFLKEHFKTKVLTYYFTLITFPTPHFFHPHIASRKQEAFNRSMAKSQMVRIPICIVLLLCMLPPRDD